MMKCRMGLLFDDRTCLKRKETHIPRNVLRLIKHYPPKNGNKERDGLYEDMRLIGPYITGVNVYVSWKILLAYLLIFVYQSLFCFQNSTTYSSKLLRKCDTNYHCFFYLTEVDGLAAERPEVSGLVAWSRRPSPLAA